MSGFDPGCSVDRVVEGGAASLRKPFQSADLAAALRAVCGCETSGSPPERER
jgi:hypothetical protein